MVSLLLEDMVRCSGGSNDRIVLVMSVANSVTQCRDRATSLYCDPSIFLMYPSNEPFLNVLASRKVCARCVMGDAVSMGGLVVGLLVERRGRWKVVRFGTLASHWLKCQEKKIYHL